jgi:protein CWC15
VATSSQGGYKRWVQSNAVSSKNLPGNMTLKMRQTGQNAKEDLEEKDYKRELEEREKLSKSKVKSDDRPVAAIEETKEETTQTKVYDDTDDVLASSDEDSDKEADGKKKGKAGDEENEDDEDSSDDDDDEELLKELAKIKRERQLEQMRKEQEEKAVRDVQRTEEALTSNPLMQPEFSDTTSESSFALKRKWNDDVIFKNQAKDEPKTKKRFINDTIRNDFHRKFLDKYMK